MNYHIENNTIFSRNEEEFLCTEVDSETVMMHTETGKYYGLDKVSTHIWQLLENNLSLSDMVNMLMEEYKVERKTCEKDTKDLLEGMLQLKMININIPTT